jgi:hypothetical protein
MVFEVPHKLKPQLRAGIAAANDNFRTTNPRQTSILSSTRLGVTTDVERSAIDGWALSQKPTAQNSDQFLEPSRLSPERDRKEHETHEHGLKDQADTAWVKVSIGLSWRDCPNETSDDQQCYST